MSLAGLIGALKKGDKSSLEKNLGKTIGSGKATVVSGKEKAVALAKKTAHNVSNIISKENMAIANTTNSVSKYSITGDKASKFVDKINGAKDSISDLFSTVNSGISGTAGSVGTLGHEVGGFMEDSAVHVKGGLDQKTMMMLGAAIIAALLLFKK